MELVRVLGIGVAGTFLSLALARHNGGYGLLTGIATGCLLLLMLFGQAEPLGASLRQLAGAGSLSSDYLSRAVRVLGLACLTEAGARICRDGGQGNVALKVELYGRVLILCAVLPAVRTVLEAAEAVLSELAP